MAIVSFTDLLRHARQHRYALSIIPVSSLTILADALAAAHTQRAPVILAPIPDRSDRPSVKALYAACETAASEADVPIALLGYQSAAADTLAQRINLGCNAVHITPTSRNFPDAVAQIKALAETGRACGIAIGGWLSGAPAADDAAESEPLPPVAECIAFAERANLEFLEVDIGGGESNKRRAKFDYDRLRRISETIAIPLMVRVEGDVLPDQIYRMIECGVALAHPSAAASARTAAAMEEQFKAWGAAGRAAEVLAHCRPWQLVEHVIEFNVQADALPRVDEILKIGRQQLASIPGVRRVRTGQAIAPDAKYRFCWLVTFANEKVAAYYRDHPLHADYANTYFRPIAGDRLTIDYRTTG